MQTSANHHSKTASLLAVFFILGIFSVSACLPMAWVETAPLCIYRLIFGFDCPGCGLTRGFVHFFHGHGFQAFRSNAMTPVIILLFAIYGLKHVVFIFWGIYPNWSTPRGQKVISRFFLILFLAQWFTRNLPQLDSLFHGMLPQFRIPFFNF